MKDIVIGAINGYGWDKIKYWVNSLDTCGFTGTKIMVCYNIDYDVVEELVKRDYSVFAFGRDDENKKLVYPNEQLNIYNDRFEHIPHFLNKIANKEDYRYIISTDVRDVIFQSNPSTWLENNIGDKSLNICAESVLVKDEPWNRETMLKVFGKNYLEKTGNDLVLNVGVVSGKFDYVLDLFTNLSLVYDKRIKAPQDQISLNILMAMKSYKDITHFNKSEDAFASQLHIHAPKYDKQYLTEPSPQIIDGVVCTSQGIPYSIVHQYDRIPEWEEIIKMKYGD
jgi:hypothetical protein